MKKIFVITCNPKKDSVKAPFVEAYIEETQKAGNKVRTINLYNIEVDYLKFNGNDPDCSLTKELKQAQDNILWADQIVFVYPIWWFAIPAKLKSFIERVFKEGVVANIGKYGPEPLLKGKTAVIMQSYDMPYFAMKYLSGDVPMKFLKVVLSNWCGLKIEKRFDFDCASDISEAKKQKLLKEIRKFASKID
jgi:putative NADPH-quinone reductase